MRRDFGTWSGASIVSKRQDYSLFITAMRRTR
jgi:hypothetical protein